MDYRVRLVTTEPTYGGRRWWFLCPLTRQDGGPPRRVAKLYLPPGGTYFGSREAYGLTYTSCQESGKFDGLYRQLAANMGTDVASIRLALKRLSGVTEEQDLPDGSSILKRTVRIEGDRIIINSQPFHDRFCVFGHGMSFSCDEPYNLLSVRIVSAAAAKHSARSRSRFARRSCCSASKRRERRKHILLAQSQVSA